MLLSGIWKPGIAFDVFGTEVALQQLVRDVALVGVTLVSLAITPRACASRTSSRWAPMQEVAKLFVGIFLTMIPVLAMLKAGAGRRLRRGRRVRSPATDGQPLPWAYFWFSGVLVVVPRQRADLPCVLQPRRRRSRSC